MRAVVTLALLVSATGLAASNQAKNRCNDAIMILRSNPSMYYEKQDVPPLALKQANAHWNQVIDGWNRASGKINQIPKEELKKDDPDLAECFEVVGKWGAYLKDLKQKIDSAEELAKVLGPFLEEVKGAEQALWVLAAAQFGGDDVLTNAKLPDAKKYLEDMAGVEKSCAKLPEAGKSPPELKQTIGGSGGRRLGGVDLPGTLTSDPNAWCFVAKNRVALMTKAVGSRNWTAEGYGNWQYMLPEVIKKLDGDGEGYMDAWVAEIVLDPSDFKAKLKKEAQNWYKELGLTMPPEPFALVDKMLAECKAKIAAKAPGLKFPDTGNHEGSIEGKAKTALLKIFPKAKVVKSSMDSPDWSINKNALGIPLDRYRSGQILFKVGSDPWCRQRSFSYAETHSGGGRYQKSSGVQIFSGTRFLACN